MSNKIEHCPHCGASMKAYIHSITPGLVSVLIKAIKYIHSHEKNEFHYKDLELNYSEASNLQKLRFHGLLAHADKDNIKSGRWLITARGGKFLRGEEVIPFQVKTFRNSVIGHSKRKIHIDDLRGKVPEFDSKFAYEFKIPSNMIIPNQNQLYYE